MKLLKMERVKTMIVPLWDGRVHQLLNKISSWVEGDSYLGE